MSEQVTNSSQRSSHRLGPTEMRSSFLLPIGISVLIWVGGILIYALAPGEFDTVVTWLIGLALLVYLFYQTRQATAQLRIIALLLASPALVGIALGLTNGRSRFVVIGVGLTVFLLAVQRFLHTPISFRVAWRQFQTGDVDAALDLINRSLLARPDFWESYQLRALIYLTKHQYRYAERDAWQALQLNAKAHPVYNTLGQIYLTEMQFEKGAEAYEQALDLDPGNPLYLYHLGLCQYRQQLYRLAVETLMATIKATLPTIIYDLLAHYYLIRSLEALAEPEQAQQVYKEGLIKFADGLPALKAQFEHQPEYPHLALMQADVADLEQRINEKFGD